MRLHLEWAGRWAARLLAALAANLLLAAQSRATDYNVRSGDVLELVVIGASELNRRIPIEVNGAAVFPLIGELQVDGTGIRDIRKTVSKRLANIIYRPSSQTTDAGVWVVQKTDVLVRVAAYRPVYVIGEVARPGEITFRPGMTVRQAIVIAGGYDPLGMQRLGTSKATDGIGLQGELTTLAAALAQARARIWRLKTALGESRGPKKHVPEPIAPAIAAKVLALEKAYLKSFSADRALEKEYLTNAIRQINERLAALKQQMSSEKAGAKIDESEAAKVDKLFSKGLVSSERVGQVRRIVLMSTTRALQTKAAIANAKHLKGELVSRLNRLDNVGRLKLLGELREANATATSLSQRLETIKFKIQHRSPRHTKHSSGVRSIHIDRVDEGKRIEASEDRMLWPGDVVEVAFNLD